MNKYKSLNKFAQALLWVKVNSDSFKKFSLFLLCYPLGNKKGYTLSLLTCLNTGHCWYIYHHIITTGHTCCNCQIFATGDSCYATCCIIYHSGIHINCCSGYRLIENSVGTICIT